jgi:hypothetical protein
MSDYLRDQIYKSMDLKETDELLGIWQTNNRAEWTDTTFEIVEEILKKRIGNIPPQNEPVLEPDNEENNEEEKDDDLEDWEAKLIDNEDQPDFYDTLEVITLRNYINIVANVAIVVYVISGLSNSEAVRYLLSGDFLSNVSDPEIVFGLFVTILGIGLQIAVTYFSLKALAHILRILMEMEFNSRKAK